MLWFFTLVRALVTYLLQRQRRSFGLVVASTTTYTTWKQSVALDGLEL